MAKNEDRKNVQNHAEESLMEKNEDRKNVQNHAEESLMEEAAIAQEVEKSIAAAADVLQDIEGIPSTMYALNSVSPNMHSAEGSSVAKAFVGLPIEALISKPFVAAALSQQNLNAVYVDTLMKLAYKSDSKSTNGKSTNNRITNTLDLTIERPVIGKDGKPGAPIKSTVKAPLLSLVPLPALTMDEVTVDFNMEVKTTETASNNTHADLSSTLEYKSWWGLDTNITGNISSDTEHKRESDSSATYTIHARAIQQPPAEGMAKLTALLSNAMEPIDLQQK